MFAKVFVLLVVSIAVALAAQPLDYNCPASKSPVHAGCKVNTNFSNKCSEVQQEMKNRINGQKDGRWQDPHNNGTYAVISETTELFELSRTTGDGKYTDMINFVFGEVANGVQCNVFACSESQVFSISDYGTNFCNIHDLYCDEPGCNPFYKLAYDEEEGKCTQADASVCTAN